MYSSSAVDNRMVRQTIYCRGSSLWVCAVLYREDPNDNVLHSRVHHLRAVPVENDRASQDNSERGYKESYVGTVHHQRHHHHVGHCPVGNGVQRFTSHGESL